MSFGKLGGALALSAKLIFLPIGSIAEAAISNSATSVGEKSPISQSTANRVRIITRNKAIDILREQECKNEPLKIKYAPLTRDIGICKDDEKYLYSLMPAELRECIQINKTHIACQIEVPTMKDEYFCLSINTEQRIIARGWRKSCSESIKY